MKEATVVDFYLFHFALILHVKCKMITLFLILNLIYIYDFTVKLLTKRFLAKNTGLDLYRSILKYTVGDCHIPTSVYSQWISCWKQYVI